MMAGNQETMADYYEMAKEIAREEKELKVERWVLISLVRQVGGSGQQLDKMKTYDLPVRMKERWEWVIRWRRAWLQCRYPRDIIVETSSYYRKVDGCDIGMHVDLARFIAAKAQFTRQQKIVDEYRREKSEENDLFYDESADEQLQAMLMKLGRKEKEILAAGERLAKKVEEYKAMNN